MIKKREENSLKLSCRQLRLLGLGPRLTAHTEMVMVDDGDDNDDNDDDGDGGNDGGEDDDGDK